jgi:hypothetical protein
MLYPDPVLWIHMGFNAVPVPDLAFQANADTDLEISPLKIEKTDIFLIKITIYLSLDLP